METTEYIWKDGEMIKWEDAQIHLLTHTLHYGGGAFEGVRAYETDKGPAIFRLNEHTERLFYSAKAIGMEIPFSVEEINNATIEVIRKNNINHAYIRPIAYYGYGKMGLNPKGAPIEVAIAAWPWGAYLPHEMIDIKVSSYIRIHPRSTVCDAKICGHYVNSILAVQELEGTKYHEALFLDTDGNIAEGPGENLFIAKDGVIHTPKLGTILAGITRSTIIEIAQSAGYEVKEAVLTVDDLAGADEAFYTGTAAEVTPIRSVDDRVIGSGEIGPVTAKIKNTYLDAVHGRNSSFEKYLSYVKS